MNRYFKKLTAFLLTLSFVFAVSGIVSPQEVAAQIPSIPTTPGIPGDTLPGEQVPAPQEKIGKCIWGSKVQQNITKPACVALAKQDGTIAAWFPNDENKVSNAPSTSDDPGWWVEKVFKPFFGWIVNVVLGFVSLLTGLAGIILNGVIYHTIVNVKENYDKIEGINVAWKTIRDLGNMGFIFVLLYAAITTILGTGKNNKELIVKIVVVAILINFSLFFTKVIIDISNVLALAFYDAIVPGAAATGFSISETGLSHAFTQYLKLTSLFGSSTNGLNLSMSEIITMGIMGSILLLISAFVFFAVALMFIIRYVVLIIVLILSPIAFLSFVLPEMNQYRDQWWKALSGQAFFAPIYFALTWISLKILAGIMGAEKAVFGKAADFSAIGNLGSVASNQAVSGASEGIVATFINFAIVIAFIIISLVIAKEWANKAGPQVGKLTSWATGAAGKATLGVACWTGRKTIGSWGGNALNDEDLKARARQGDMGARLKLATAGKVAKSSFDMRATGLGGIMGSGKAQKGGWVQDQKDLAKKFEKYKPDKKEIDKYKGYEAENQKKLDVLAEKAITKSNEHTEDEDYLKTLRGTTTKGMDDAAATAHAARIKLTQEKVDEHEKELAKKRKEYAENSSEPTVAETRARRDTNAAQRQSLEKSMENMAVTSEKRNPTLRVAAKIPFTKKIINYAIKGSGYVIGGKDRAAAIRAAAKGKSNAEKIAELAVAEAKEKEKAEGGGEEKPKEEKAEGGEEEKK